MPRGHLRVWTNGRRETIFEVHSWPSTDHWPRVCSSVCADREGAEAPVDWKHPRDEAEINQRLAASDAKSSTGKAKGRVLYLLDHKPLGGGRLYIVAVALVTRKKAGLYQLYRLCFNGAVPHHQREIASVDLVNAAKDLAATGKARLHIAVMPDTTAGKMCKAYGLGGGTTTDQDGQVWVCA